MRFSRFASVTLAFLTAFLLASPTAFLTPTRASARGERPWAPQRADTPSAA